MVKDEIPVEDRVSIILHCNTCGQDKEMTSHRLLHAQGKVIKGTCGQCSGPAVLNAPAPRQAAKTIEEIRAHQWEMICPKEYRTTTEGGNTDAKRLNKAKATFEGASLTGSALFNACKSQKRMVFAGPSGSMKTRYAWRVVHEAFKNKADVVEFTAWSFQAAAQDAGGKYQSDQWMKALSAVGFILFDDMGKTPWTENTWAAFFELLERRNNQDRDWLITMNDTRDDIRTVMGGHKSNVVKSITEPLIRRMEDFAKVFIFEKP